MTLDRKLNEAAENFIKDLTGAGTDIIRGYITEIVRDRDFHERLKENRSNPGRRQYSSWGIDIGTTMGTVLYTLCRIKHHGIVVETGVASGVSSSYILCALEHNRQGRLYSIDLPRIAWTAREDKKSSGAEGEQPSGWIIPDYLRSRWQLIIGRSADTLAPLLQETGDIDIFLHDSDHTYQNMLREFKTAWPHLKMGGLLLVHNIDMSNAFHDYCRSNGLKGHILADMGGIVKV